MTQGSETLLEQRAPSSGVQRMTSGDAAGITTISADELREKIIWNTQRALLDYWIHMRGDSDMPSRENFDPTSIPKLLTRIGLIDVIRPGPRFQYRVVGSTMARNTPQKLEGTFVDELLHEDYAVHLALNFNLLCGMQRPVYIVENTNFQTEYVETVSRLLLPLGRTPPEVDMILYSTMHARNADSPERRDLQHMSGSISRKVVALKL